VSVGVTVSLLFVFAFLAATVILIRRKPPEIRAEAEEHESMSLVTIYLLIEEFLDFGPNFESNTE
jgi:hypothetical protein